MKNFVGELSQYLPAFKHKESGEYRFHEYAAFSYSYDDCLKLIPWNQSNVASVPSSSALDLKDYIIMRRTVVLSDWEIA